MRLLVNSGDEGEKGKRESAAVLWFFRLRSLRRQMVPTVEEGVLDPDLLTRVPMGDELESSAGGLRVVSLKTRVL